MLCYCRWFHTQVGSVNLYDARKRQSKNLSAGILCRLSVVIACIGNADILILDKTTTKLDPVSRRHVGVAIFLGFSENNVAFGVLTVMYFIFLSLPLLSLCVGRCGRFLTYSVKQTKRLYYPWSLWRSSMTFFLSVIPWIQRRCLHYTQQLPSIGKFSFINKSLCINIFKYQPIFLTFKARKIFHYVIFH